MFTHFLSGFTEGATKKPWIQPRNSSNLCPAETCLVQSSTEEQLSELGEEAEMWRSDMYDSAQAKHQGFPVEGSKSTKDIGHAEDDSILLNSQGSNKAPEHSNLGPYFQDGQRRIDYILTYHIDKMQRARHHSTSTFKSLKESLTCIGKRNRAGSTHHDPESASNAHIHRDEFEQKLIDMGLELEREEDAKIPDMGFLKIHAPWQVLCREAEFMKLKMPTKKKYEVSKGSSGIHVMNTFIKRLSAPLTPQIEEKSPQNEKHISYPFSREKHHLFDLSDRDSFFDSKIRASIVCEIIKRVKCIGVKDIMGINTLIARGVYTSAYPLHDGDFEGVEAEPNDRKVLYEQWARYSLFYKYQPIGLIRKYFGEKIGLYFAWLGVYTEMLIPAAVIGVIVFLFGCVTVDSDIPSMEICDERNNITMCPLCDRACSYWKLIEACGTARASHLFDNEATVFFSIFMALWATMFMEHWKRRQMRLNYIWDLTGYEDEENQQRPEYEFHVRKKRQRKETNSTDSLMHGKHKLTCKDRMPAYMTILMMMVFLIFVTFAIVFGVVLYRISIKTALHMSSSSPFRSNIRATVKTTAALINLIIIIIMDEIYGMVARWLTVLEVPKTDKSFEERLIFKAFVLKFANAFTPIVYLAFFRGRLIGRPGNYYYVVGNYRMEECAHAGCLMELCIQLCITMLGKQLIQNNLFEIGIPKLKKLLRRRKSKRDSKQEEEFYKTLARHEKDHFLSPYVGLNPEYMEMMIQFGMVTLFVASFPLAPLFALLNNVIEIRLDAKKFVTEFRRPIAAKAKDIGIWYNLLRGLSKVAVIVNAFVISFTSDFIPRLVYQYVYSPDGTLHGFVNHTLSYFNVTDFEPQTEPMEPMFLGYKVDVCRYKDYRDSPWSDTPYELSREFWNILAARLAFVIIFQNVVMLMSDFVDWIIPDIPKDISLQIHKEKNLIVELFMKEEQGKRLKGKRKSNPSPKAHTQSPLHVQINNH
ncbi:anoctamin-1a isoform X2 [Silurus meridionalis]|uniref:anoctamin-1a isoform X2 n=1 Tax=Silurus meridionalis TaxID=175797 RepID=UPI001EEAFE72|nr:anoctamin-1a isoform X2 [Silurus meridionalis]